MSSGNLAPIVGETHKVGLFAQKLAVGVGLQKGFERARMVYRGNAGGQLR